MHERLSLCVWFLSEHSSLLLDTENGVGDYASQTPWRKHQMLFSRVEGQKTGAVSFPDLTLPSQIT